MTCQSTLQTASHISSKMYALELIELIRIIIETNSVPLYK